MTRTFDDYLAAQRHGLTRTLGNRLVRLHQAETAVEKFVQKHLPPGTPLLVWRALGNHEYETVRATFCSLMPTGITVRPHPDDAHLLPECLRFGKGGEYSILWSQISIGA
jgi:hypothetical protein